MIESSLKAADDSRDTANQTAIAPTARRAPKLSVALITYNQERFIGEALESVLAQRTSFPIEVVVGEDCSTDATRSIVTEFSRRYPDRIVPLLQERNVGMVRNFRATLAACRGEYLAIMEGDDYWTCTDKLQRQVDFLESHSGHALCCHRVHVRDETGTRLVGIFREGVFPGLEWKAGTYAIEDLIADNFIANASVVYRAASVGYLPDWFLDLEFCDWPLHLLVAHTGKIQLMNEIMGVYRIHSRSLHSSRPPADQRRSLIPMFKAVDRHLQFRYAPAFRRTIAGYYFDIASVEHKNGNRRATISNLVQCVRTGKLNLPGRFVDWASLVGYGIFGIRRFRWWRQQTDTTP